MGKGQNMALQKVKKGVVYTLDLITKKGPETQKEQGIHDRSAFASMTPVRPPLLCRVEFHGPIRIPSLGKPAVSEKSRSLVSTNASFPTCSGQREHRRERDAHCTKLRRLLIVVNEKA